MKVINVGIYCLWPFSTVFGEKNNIRPIFPLGRPMLCIITPSLFSSPKSSATNKVHLIAFFNQRYTLLNENSGIYSAYERYLDGKFL